MADNLESNTNPNLNKEPVGIENEELGSLDDEALDFQDEPKDDENTDSLPVPGDDEAFYEKHFESIQHGVKNFTDEEAKNFAAYQGLQSVITQNAHLTQTIKAVRRQALISMTITLALVSLLVAMLIVFAIYPKTTYIATKDNSAICEVEPRNNPNLTDTTIADFAKDGVINLYSMDYANYENQIDDVLSRYYTTQGRLDTIAALKASGILDTVNSKALTLRAGASGTARIEQKGIGNNGKDFWVVRFPMTIDVYSGMPTPETQQKHMVTVRVVADTASALNPKGLGITSVTLSPIQ